MALGCCGRLSVQSYSSSEDVIDVSATALTRFLEQSIAKASDESKLAEQMTDTPFPAFNVTVPVLLINYLESRQGSATEILAALVSRLEAGRSESIPSRSDPHFKLEACPSRITTVFRLNGTDLQVTLANDNFVLNADRESTCVTIRSVPATIASSSLEGSFLKDIFDAKFVPSDLKVGGSRAEGNNSIMIACEGRWIEVELSKQHSSVKGSDDALSAPNREC